jgi:hypothetical protein
MRPTASGFSASNAAPAAAKTTLTPEIWLGVTFVRARNAAAAFAHPTDREAIGRRFASSSGTALHRIWGRQSDRAFAAETQRPRSVILSHIGLRETDPPPAVGDYRIA